MTSTAVESDCFLNQVDCDGGMGADGMWDDLQKRKTDQSTSWLCSLS